MSITVICELHIQADRMGEIVQTAIAQLSLPAQSVAGRRAARLYQHIDDPSWLLYVAEWESQRAFEAYRQAAPMPGRPDQFQEMPVCRLYHRIALFERVLAAIQVATARIIDGPPETQAARRDVSLAYHRTNARHQPGLVLLTIQEASDDPPGLLVLSGWESGLTLDQIDRRAEAALIQELEALGGGVQTFVGRSLVEPPMDDGTSAAS